MRRHNLALALLLACAACDTPEEKAYGMRCTRAGGFIIVRSDNGGFNGERYLCVKEFIPPVTPEADDAKK